MSAALCGILLIHSVSAATLEGFARHYGKSCSTHPVFIDHKNIRPWTFRSRNFSIVMERTTLGDLQKQYKGEIQQNDNARWLCYHSQAENVTWWFIARNTSEHNNLSTIMLASMDHHAKCATPARPIYLSGIPAPLLGATRDEIANYFKIPSARISLCQRFISMATSKNSSTINALDYYFKNDQVVGMSLEQLTRKKE